MAERRMFTKKITESDAFLDMSLDAQCLYFHLGMESYDKGIVINAESFAKMLRCSNALEELEQKGYITKINNGDFNCYSIVHWYENNGIGETAKKRNNYTYRKWRESVLKRDRYRCKECGDTNNLEVHHIKPFARFPELRFDLDNGLTLCRKCHNKLHKEKRNGYL